MAFGPEVEDAEFFVLRAPYFPVVIAIVAHNHRFAYGPVAVWAVVVAFYKFTLSWAQHLALLTIVLVIALESACDPHTLHTIPLILIVSHPVPRFEFAMFWA